MKIWVYLKKRGTEKEINKKPGLNFRESRLVTYLFILIR